MGTIIAVATVKVATFFKYGAGLCLCRIATALEPFAEL